MTRALPAIFFVLIVSGVCFSQGPPNTAPIKWEKYSVKNARATVLFPKLPVVLKHSLICQGEESADFGAYADGTAYVLGITVATPTSRFCPHPHDFDQSNFEKRLVVLRSSLDAPTESEIEKDGRKWKQMRDKEHIYFLLNDPERKRWFELRVFGGDETRPEVSNFLSSLAIVEKTTGIAIKDGSEINLGDDLPADQIPAPILLQKQPLPGSRSSRIDPQGDKGDDKPSLPVVKMDDSYRAMVIALKEVPAYTESARRSGETGTAALRVNFRANGTVGEITTVRTLSRSLMERCYAAVKKTVFVPAKKDNVPISVSRVIEYNFNLY